MGRTVKHLLSQRMRVNPTKSWSDLLPAVIEDWNNEHNLKGLLPSHITPTSFYGDYEGNLRKLWETHVPQRFAGYYAIPYEALDATLQNSFKYKRNQPVWADMTPVDPRLGLSVFSKISEGRNKIWREGIVLERTLVDSNVRGKLIPRYKIKLLDHLKKQQFWTYETRLKPRDADSDTD